MVPPSDAVIASSCAASVSMVSRRKSNRWHRPTMVAGILCGSVVASTKRTPDRRLLEHLQQRVERLAREPLRLVDDVDLLATHRRSGGGAFAELARVLDTAVRGRVDLDDVQVLALADGDALRAARRTARPSGPFSQLTIFARIRAVDVLPVPRGPQNRNA